MINDIDVKNFWTNIDNNKITPFHSNLSNFDLIEKRNNIEFDIIYNSIKDYKLKILDIGCGPGRIINTLQKNNILIDKYTGLDLSQPYIDYCNKNFSNKDINFDSFDINNDQIINKINDDYNIFFLAGVLQYLNDEMVNSFLKEISLLSNNYIYIKNTISYDKRFIINNKYSTILDANYSSIYRTNEEYNYFYKILENIGFKLYKSDYLYPHLENFKESGQKYTIYIR